MRNFVSNAHFPLTKFKLMLDILEILSPKTDHITIYKKLTVEQNF